MSARPPENVERSDALAAMLSAVEAMGAMVAGLERRDLDERIRAARERLSRATFNVLVVGEFKKGKSTLINSLLNAPVCPVDDDIATARPIVIRYAETAAAQVVYRNEEGAAERPQPTEAIQVAQINEYATELGANPDMVNVERVEVGLPRQLLANGLVLIDTPGVGGLGSTHSTVTVGALPMADGVVFVSDASQEYTAPELEFMRTARAMCPNLVCVMTKTDFYPGWRKILELNQQHLARQQIWAPVICTSATLRQAAIERNDRELNAESGYPDLVNYLRHEIVSKAERLHIDQVARDLGEVLGQLEAQYQAEQAILDDPDKAQAVMSQLAEAKARGERLRSQAARWQQTLSDGISDLTADVEHDLRVRFREMIRQGEEALDNSDPADTWAEFEPWLYNRTSTEVVRNYTYLHQRSTELSRRVAEHFAVDHQDALAQLDISNPYDVWKGAGEVTKVELTESGAVASALTALRGTSGGVIMFSLFGKIALGAVGLAAVPLTAVAMPLGLVLGVKTLRDERKRALTQRRMQAKAAVRKYADEVSFQVGKDSRDNLRRVQRQLRDYYVQRADDLNTSTAESLKAAAEAVKADQAQREQRKAQIVNDRKKLEQLRSIVGGALAAKPPPPLAGGAGGRPAAR